MSFNEASDPLKKARTGADGSAVGAMLGVEAAPRSGGGSEASRTSTFARSASREGRVDMASGYTMIDVGGKAVTRRRALACGRIDLGQGAYPLVRDGKLPKGDALSLAEVAGILAAKKVDQLIPLCHPLGLDQVALAFDPDDEALAVTVFCQVVTSGRTGVEMEALAGVNLALLTIWDLSKPIEAALGIGGVRLLKKEGGTSGTWVHPDGLPPLPERFR
ncbi:MAG: cyclic pyranopterin monophosphate synthase MoaC [Trueperaceae bacterium]|nr:cyclic pyranopterin monophosphate synthase MoaC [Trueperaceae bacterium]